MEDLELVLKVGREELGAVEVRTGQKLNLPLSFWGELSASLRHAGYLELSAAIDQALRAAQIRARLFAEKLRCMEPAYDPEAQARCQVLLEEDLRPEKRP